LNPNCDIALTGGSDLLVADRVVVGIHTIVPGEGIEQFMRRRSNKIGVGVGDTARTETGSVEGAYEETTLRNQLATSA
jgi:hypothetical protein